MKVSWGSEAQAVETLVFRVAKATAVSTGLGLPRHLHYAIGASQGIAGLHRAVGASQDAAALYCTAGASQDTALHWTVGAARASYHVAGVG